MKKSVLILLYLLGVGVAALAAVGQTTPGYMDADYYYTVGTQIANGEGFTEPYLWNYLDDPAGIPHPSHLYWMPLTSWIAAAGMTLAGSTEFWAARIFFILLAGLIPVISASLSTSLLREKKYAWVAGLLGVFPGLYVIYLSIPETFILYLVLGGLFWLLILKNDWVQLPAKKLLWAAGLLGILAGLMHLSRADGILWATGGGLWLVFIIWKRKNTSELRIAMMGLGIFIIGYSLIMGAWYARNLDLFGSLMPPGNSRTMWITEYNQTFYYPADQLTLENWLNTSLNIHLNAWWTAFSMNIKNLVAVQGLVILLPLMISGLWANRHKAGIKFAAALWLTNFVVMTMVFPYAGARGGYLHSASAFQCLLWAAVPAGLEQFTDWGRRKRNWQPEKSIPVFATLLVVISANLTGWFYLQKVVGTGEPETRWGSYYTLYENVLDGMKTQTVDENDLFMVNNPPGFFIATGYSSIVIPGGGIDQTIAAASRYDVDYLILEEGQENLAELYENPRDIDELQYLTDISGARIFCFACK